MVSILEGEGLLNDATALVLYRVAVAAAVTGTFSIGETGVELAVSAVGGTAVGLAVGFIGSRVLRRVSEAPVENTVKLLLPYVAWLAAERLHASGVLAVLACGMLMARHWASISSGARLQARQLWDWLVFVLEGLSFVLVGVQLRTVVDGIEGAPWPTWRWPPPPSTWWSSPCGWPWCSRRAGCRACRPGVERDPYRLAVAR